MRDTDRRAYEVLSRTNRFRRMVDGAKRIADAGFSKGRTVVSMSWGKDSCALGHLCWSMFGRIDMMHMACAHELPGGETVQDYFRQRGTIHELPPLNTLSESLVWLRDVGLPHERSHAAHQKIIQTRKRSRADDWAVANGYATQVLGMRAQESNVRRRLFRGRGTTYQRASGTWICNPLAWWTVRDVWTYLVANEIPWHPLYDCETLGFTREKLRNGGWLYTDGATDGWVAWLREHYPAQYLLLITEFPRMEQLA